LNIPGLTRRFKETLMEHTECNQHNNREGSALIISMILLIVVMGLAGSYLTLSISGARITSMEIDRTHARFLAETAIHHSVFELGAGNLGDIWWESFGGGMYNASVTDCGTDTDDNDGDGAIDEEDETNFRIIIGVGSYGDEVHIIEAMVARVKINPFTGAAYGNTSVALAVYADSYDSEDGTYESQVTNSISLEDENESCTTCAGTGTETCVTCSGSGDASCLACGGAGNLPCATCSGAGGSVCGTCGGSGALGVCGVCSGTGRTPVGCTFCGGDGTKDNGQPCNKCDPCWNCGGTGAGGACGDCGADGIIECATCGGSGEGVPDPACGGDGLVTCSMCEGGGSVTCGTCGGTGVTPSDPVTYAGTEGDVGANDEVIIAASGIVFGNANSGPDGTVTNGGYVYGDTGPNPTDFDFPIPVYNPVGTSLGILSGSSTITGGTYRYDSVSVAGQSEVTIEGDVTMYVDGDFLTAGGAAITLAPGATLTIHHGSGDFHVAGQGLVNESAPTSLFIYSSAQTTMVDDPENPGEKMPSSSFHFNGQADFSGAVFAPGADMKLNGQTVNYGSLIGKNITTSGSGKVIIHYDEALGRLDLDLYKKIFRRISWRTIFILRSEYYIPPSE